MRGGAAGCWAVVFSQVLGGAGLFIPDSNPNLGLIIILLPPFPLSALPVSVVEKC